MKKLLLTIGLVAALAIPLAAFAATSDAPAAKTIRGFCGMDTSKLTEEQKANCQQREGFAGCGMSKGCPMSSN